MKACKLSRKSGRAVRRRSVRSALNGNKALEFDMTGSQSGKTRGLPADLG